MRVKPRAKVTRKIRAVNYSGLKPHIVPEDMVVVVDTREQEPLWCPKTPKGLTIVRDTVKVGDYTIRGMENMIGIERKKVTDLLSYLTSERDRTREKLYELKKLDFRALVIEVYESELWLPKFYSNISPEVIRQSLVSFEVKFGLHVYYGTRADLERKVLDWLIYFYNLKRSAHD
jgi:ERCC4-type nuclease